jgi:hypothetical protein
MIDMCVSTCILCGNDYKLLKGGNYDLFMLYLLCLAKYLAISKWFIE